MALATLTIDINARLASLEKDMGRMAQIAQREADRMEAAFSAAGVTLAGLFAGVSVGALTSGFVGLVNQIDALNDAADATGSSIEKISGLEDIAMRTGASLEDVTSIMVKFNGVLKDADGKNAASQTLKAIGLSAEELRKMDPADALLEVSKALDKYRDDGTKARAVQEWFGKSVKEAAPFLKDLAEAGQINAKYTKEQAEQAEKFNKQMAVMQTGVNALARDIASKFLPVLNDLITDLKSGAEAYGSFTSAAFDIGWNVDPMKSLNENMTDTVVRIREVKEKLADLTSRKNQSFIGSALSSREIAELRTELDLLEKREKYLLARQKMAGGGRGGNGAAESDKPSVPDVKPPSTEPKKADPVPEIQREIEALERKLQAAKNLTEFERVLDDLEKKRFKNSSITDIGKALDLASQVDNLKRLEEATKAQMELEKKQQELKERNAAEAQKYFEASLTPSEKLEATLKRINELYDTGAFGTLGSAEAMDKYSRAVAAAKNETDQLNEAAKEMADIFTRAAERGDDLASALETIIKKKLIFEPMAKSLEAGFSDLFALAGSVFGGGSAGASTSQYSLAGGSGLKLPGHKDGLDFVPYDNYVARLHKGERVLTAGENARYGQGAGVTVINYNTIGSGVSRAEVYAAMEQARQNTLATLAEQQRNRGVI